jgi:DNA-binding winged helix-turn-helix (wHTH) protein/tetratricopeptide (TPR) repeat protein
MRADCQREPFTATAVPWYHGRGVFSSDAGLAVTFRFGGFELDEDLRELRRDGRRVPMQGKLLDLLLYLIRFRGRIVSREELLANVWSDAVVTDHALEQALYQTRRVLGDHGGGRAILETVRRRGLRFVAEVTEVEDRPEFENAPFVGRAKLLGDLDRALRAASGGRGGLVFLSGEPGIGKTRAAEQFAMLAREQGAVAHLGRCSEVEGAPAFWPWVQLLRAHVAACRPSRLRELLAGGAGDLAQIVPEIRPDRSDPAALPILDPGPARFRLFDSMARFWQRASEGEPIVLILDDLHRADDPSWLLLRFLAPELGSSRILVVGTYREVELHRDRARAASLGELTRLASTRCFELEGFSREEVERFVELTIAGPLSAETVTVLHEHSNGNPFFLTQLAPQLDRRRGGDSNKNVRGELRLELPRSVREAITQQLAGLSPTCRELLTVAAVIGRDFTLSALELATEHSRETVLDAVSAASEAGTIQQSRDRIGHFRFQHILVRDALRESLSTVDRAGLHKRVGEVLERLYGVDTEEHLAELAYHFAEALAAGEEERAIGYTAAAGRAAMEHLAFEEAARQYERALEIVDLSPTPDDRRLFDLLLALGEAGIRAGLRDSARKAFHRAAGIAGYLGEPERLARVALGVAPGFFAIETGVYDPLIVSLLEDALAALPSGDTALRAMLLGRLAMALYWSDSFPRRERLIQEAVEIVERLGDPATTAYVMQARIVALWGPDSFNDRALQSTEVIEKAEEAGDRELSLIGRVFRVVALLEAAEREDFDRELDVFCTLLQDPRHLSTRWYAPLFRAMRATIDGSFDDAESLAKEFLAEGQRFEDANAIHAFGTLIATVRWHQGRSGEMIDGLYDNSVRYPALLGWRCALAAFLADNGLRERAMREVRWIARHGLSELPRDMHWLLCTTLLAEACGIVADPAWSAVVYRQLKPYKDRLVVFGYGVGSWGSVSRSLGILATAMSRWAEAERYFQAALALETRSRMQPWVAWTLLAFARMLVIQGRRSDRDRAAELATAARRIGLELGMTRLTDAASELLGRR